MMRYASKTRAEGLVGGDQESADFLNRVTGHKVLFAEDYKHNADGNGGRVWIEGHPHTSVHNQGGGKGEHTFHVLDRQRGHFPRFYICRVAILANCPGKL